MTTLGTEEQKSLAEAGTLTVAHVLNWDTATLTARGDAWSTQASSLTSFDDTRYRAVDASRDFWTGSAAEAMRSKHEAVRTSTKAFITALQNGASAAQAGASSLESAKGAVVNAVRAAQANGYEVGDDGTTTISASTHQTLLSQLDASSYSTAAGALQVDADASTTAVKQALENARTAASTVQAEIEKAFATLPDGDPAIVLGAPQVSTSPSLNTVYAQTTDNPYPEANAENGARMPVESPRTVQLDPNKYTTDWTPWDQTWSVPSGSINEGTSYRVRLVEMTEKEIYNNDGKSMIVWEPKYEIQEQKMVVPITGGQGYPVAMPPGEWRSASIDEVMTVQRNSPTTLNIPDPTKDIK